MNWIITGAVILSSLVGGMFGGSLGTSSTYDSALWSPITRLTLGATSFPTSLDTFTNPGATDSVATVSHSGQHSNANDAIEALEAKVGITASTPVSGSVLVGDGTGTSRWSTFATTTSLSSTNLLITGSSTLQNFTFVNATGTAATTTNMFSTTASSTNLFSTNTNFGFVNIGHSTTTNATTTTLFSTTASSTNLFSADASFGRATTTDLDINTVSYTWPSSQGAANEVLTNNGSGGLSWSAPASSGDIAGNGSILSTAAAATTTLRTIKISSGDFLSTDGLKIEMITRTSGGAGPVNVFDIQVGDGTASTTIANDFYDTSTSFSSVVEAWLFNSSATAQKAYYRVDRLTTAGNFNNFGTSTPAVNTANDFYLSFRANAKSGGGTAYIDGISVRRLTE